MKQATIKTLGAVALGAAAVAAGAGSASAVETPNIDGVTSTLTGTLQDQQKQIADRAGTAVRDTGARPGGNTELLGGLPVDGTTLPTNGVSGMAPGGLLG